MQPITVPTEDSTFGPFAELKQVSVAADEEISAVNALLQDGWKLLHVGHTNKHTVYVLGRPPQQSRRRTGFLAAQPGEWNSPSEAEKAPQGLASDLLPSA